jgi:flagellar hook-length control protein FliK
VQAPTPAPAAPATAAAPAPATATTPAAPATATATPADPAADAAPVLADLPAPAATGDDKPAQAPVSPAPQQAAPAADAPAQPNAGDTGGRPQPQAEPTAQPAPASDAAAAPKADAPAAPTASQPLEAPAPAHAPQAASALERAVPLYRAPQIMAAVIHLAQERGVTHARINLKPAELGGIEVRLHSTPQGISAHLVADSPEAAKALSQAGDDLRRQLEAKDVTLLSLDVSTSGDDRREAGFGGDATGGDPNRPNGGRSGSRVSAEPSSPAPAETTLVLPEGVLVDVLA